MALLPELQEAIDHVRMARDILESHALKPIDGLSPLVHRRELERRLYAVETLEQTIRWVQRLDSDLDGTVSTSAVSRFADTRTVPGVDVH